MSTYNDSPLDIPSNPSQDSKAGHVWTEGGMRLQCLRCGKLCGGSIPCKPNNHFSNEARSSIPAVRAFLCIEDKDQLNRIEAMLKELLSDVYPNSHD